MRTFHRVAGTLAFLFLIAASAAQTHTPGEDVREHLALAQQALANKHFDVAESELQSVLTADANNLEARANLGVVEFLQGKYAEADKDLRVALRLQPNLWQAQAILGLCEKAQRKLDSAQSLLETSFPHLQDPQLRMRAGMALVELDYQHHGFEPALAVLASLQKLDAANPDVLYVTYRIHADLAAQARDNLAMAAPDSARMHQLLAEHLVTEGKIKDAIPRRLANRSPPSRGAF